MKVKYLGCSRRIGTSAKTGNPYDICVINYTVPQESKKTDAYNFVAYGDRVMELPLDTSKVGDFASLQVGKEIELTLSPNPSNPSRNICTGFS